MEILGDFWIVLGHFQGVSEFRKVFEISGDFWSFLDSFGRLLRSFREFRRVLDNFGEFLEISKEF